jgi:protein gp37
MSTQSTIEWTDTTWNPVRGCSIVSPGCVNCYAMKQAHRFNGPGKPYEGLTKLTKAGPQWTGAVRTIDRVLLEPLSWRRPRRVFVNSMSDLFHEDVPDAFIDRVFAVMALAQWHTFQVLTKRADRMRQYMNGLTFERVRHWMNRSPDGDELTQQTPAGGFVPNGKENLTTMARRTKDYVYRLEPQGMPLRIDGPPFRNVWLGVSVEDQKHADERIPQLAMTPAAVRFVSYEPALGPVDFTQVQTDTGVINALWSYTRRDAAPSPWSRLDWIIVGGESGPGARPFDLAWARSIVQQCKAAGVACFVKQVGSRPDGWWTNELGPRLNRHGIKHRKGGDPSEWPEDLRVREFPATVTD